jgi:1-phosphatidylinositol phosphodiesterase
MNIQKTGVKKVSLRLSPPTLSSATNDTVTYDESIKQTITIPPWKGINKTHTTYLKASGKDESGHTIDIDLLNAAQVTSLEETEGFFCEFPNHWLSNLADGSPLSITLAVCSETILKPENLSSTQYKLSFKKPLSQLTPITVTSAVNTSRWMTDTWETIKRLKAHELLLPSAHHAGFDQDHSSFPEETWGACQDYSFYTQLKGGIRVLDLRMIDRADGTGDRFQFKHGAWYIKRYARHCGDELTRFLNENPLEFVIVDFHALEAGRSGWFDFLHMLRDLPTNRGIPKEAKNLTLEEIRRQYPGKNIIFASDSQFTHWPKIPHKFLDQAHTEEDLNNWITMTMRAPP